MSLSPLKELWSQSVSAVSERCVETTLSSYETTARQVNWMIENRGGLAHLAGYLLVPSQFYPGREIPEMENVYSAAGGSLFTMHPFECGEGELSLRGILCMPNGWNKTRDDRCIVYCNPNGIITQEYFQEGKLEYTAGQLLDLNQCPLLLFDYRGVGMNKGVQVESSVSPTYASVVRDGKTVLEYAFSEYSRVDLWGSSLGGGVATVALEQYLQEHTEKASVVRLFNHDSFSTTPRVIFPNYPKVADFFGWCVGGLIDAKSSMERLIDRQISVTILYQDRDPVIPAGARMGEVISPNVNVKIIHTNTYGHADLNDFTIRALSWS